MKKTIFILLFSFLSLLDSFAQIKPVYLRYINMRGHQSFTQQILLDVLKLKENAEFTGDYIKAQMMELEKFYHKQGYSLCKVSGYVDLDNSLNIQIHEGIIEDVIFLKLGYFQIFLVREEFGSYKNLIFYKPLIEKKISNISNIAKLSKLEYEFMPVDNKPGYYYLYLSRAPGEKREGEPEPYVDVYFNFRGWALSLVPYLNVTFFNLGGIDHSFRFGADVRFSTEHWLDFSLDGLQESVVNEYYTLNYFSPPFYQELRGNFRTGIIINRLGRGDLKASFKTIRFPFELGVGFDFKYFWASFTGGAVYEKLRNIDLDLDSPVSLDLYPELLIEKETTYNTIAINLSRVERKKYVNEKDDFNRLRFEYQFNETYRWWAMDFEGEKFFISGYDLFILRYRAVYMRGKYPIYYQFGLPSDYHLRGYSELYTDRAIDGGFEMWNSLDGDFLHEMFFIDWAWFNNTTFNYSHLNMGDFALAFGVGISFSWKELNLRFHYALPIKERADRGSFNFFFRKRF